MTINYNEESMGEKYDEQERLKEAIDNIVRENLYLYLLEIDYERKEILICLTEKLLWNLVPMNPESFTDFTNDFSGYTIVELEENLAKYHVDRNSLLSKN